MPPSVWAPNARGVSVVGDWNHWRIGADRMSSQGASGVWATRVADAQVGARYKYAVEGVDGQVRLKADPMARQCEHPPSTASIITASRHKWGDQARDDRRDARDRDAHHPMRIYEVHAGSWRPGLTYRDLAEELADYVEDLGFTHVELMPVMEHPSAARGATKSRGTTRPRPRYGTPDDFRFFVDRLHQRGIGVIADWVPAHFPKDDWALAASTARPCTSMSTPVRASTLTGGRSSSTTAATRSGTS